MRDVAPLLFVFLDLRLCRACQSIDDPGVGLLLPVLCGFADGVPHFSSDLDLFV